MAESDRHRNKLVVGIRGADEQLRDEARDAAKAAGYTGLSDFTIRSWQWLARRPGSHEPRRPKAGVVAARNLVAELERVVADLYEREPTKARQIMSDVSNFETDWWGSHG